MISEQEFKRLRSEVEEAKSAAERNRGALNQLMEDLKETHGCETVKEAKALLEKKQTELKKAEKEFDTAFAAYQNKWKKNGESDGD